MQKTRHSAMAAMPAKYSNEQAVKEALIVLKNDPDRQFPRAELSAKIASFSCVQIPRRTYKSREDSLVQALKTHPDVHAQPPLKNGLGFLFSYRREGTLRLFPTYSLDHEGQVIRSRIRPPPAPPLSRSASRGTGRSAGPSDNGSSSSSSSSAAIDTRHRTGCRCSGLRRAWCARARHLLLPLSSLPPVVVLSFPCCAQPRLIHGRTRHRRRGVDLGGGPAGPSSSCRLLARCFSPSLP